MRFYRVAKLYQSSVLYNHGRCVDMRIFAVCPAISLSCMDFFFAYDGLKNYP